MSKIYDALQHLEAQRRAKDSGETPTAINPLDLQERPVPVARAAAQPQPQPLLEQATSVMRFGAELQRRMSESGLEGVQGLFALADRLHRALATVSHPEIDTMEADLDRVAHQISVMKENVRQLKAVKVGFKP